MALSKNKYFHIKKLWIPLYRGRVAIIITNDAKKLSKRVGIFNDNEVYAHFMHDQYKGGRIIPMIVLNFDYEGRHIYQGTVAHECLHAAFHIADSRGVMRHDDEAICYLVEWLTDKVSDFAKKKGFKIR